MTVSWACSAPPTNERHQAEGALAAARAAEAETYAPDELRMAETALARYDEAVAQRDYRLALARALEARNSAYEAVKRAGDEKAAARSRAEHLLASVEELHEAATSRLSSSSAPRLSPAAAEHLRSAVTLAGQAMQEARAAVSHQDYRGAATRLTPIVEQLDALTTPASGRRTR